MDNVAARLVLRYGKTDKPEYQLTNRPVTLGREAINDVVLSDPEISRRHARLFVQDGQFFLEDLGSTNGTFINGRRVHAPTRLQDSDVIEFGESIRLQFLQANGDEAEHLPTPVIIEAELPPAAQERLGPTKPLPGEPPAPPPVYRTPPTDTDLLTAPDEWEEEPVRSGRGRVVLGCGCLVLVVLFICAVTLFILDAQFPNVLYCGPLRGFFELFSTLTCPIP